MTSLVTHLRTTASPVEFVDALFELLHTEGQRHYEEDVTQIEHALQTAAQLDARTGDGTSDEGMDRERLVVAGLLHDIGHLVLGEAEGTDRDHRHEAVGARLLQRFFGPEICQPILLHVPAKRYLCATLEGYGDTLSTASLRSLELQGGPFDAENVRDFAAAPASAAAIALRRADDAGKVIDLSVAPLEQYRDRVLALTLPRAP